MSDIKAIPHDVHTLAPARHSFRTLLATNPNYFGSFPELGLEAVEAKAGDTFFEELTCVSYSPTQDRIEATLVVKRAFGYSGGPCTPGSFEHVRFYIDYGSGWEDVGPAAINVHDIPIAIDCTEDPTHPLSYACGVAHAPKRQWCGTPVLPRIRAILSWNLAPPADMPEWKPPWGNVLTCRAQIDPRRFIITDIIGALPAALAAELPPHVLNAPPLPTPDPGPLAALPLHELAAQYRATKVPPHRFAFKAATATATEAFSSSAAFIAGAAEAQHANIDFGAILEALEDVSGNTTYEELDCLGLDNAQQALVATFKVKLQSGYSGPPCSAGSTEYVAFWADWEDNCTLQYLGTVPVKVHDYKKLDGGLCYAAILPVDLGALRQDCSKPVLRRVRAVLSWNAAPSKVNPDAVPVWGNAIERHVQIAPGDAYDGHARFTIVGGVAATEINFGTGLTGPEAKIAYNGAGVPPDYAFAGTIVLHGPTDPALVGHQYRIRATNADVGGGFLLTHPFDTVDKDALHVTVTPDPVTGWVPWPTWANNNLGKLGETSIGGEDRWVFDLELDTPGHVVSQASTQIDNTLRDTVIAGDTVNMGDLHLSTGGACHVPHALLHGTFIARDAHFAGWSFGLLGGPTGSPPQPTVAVSGGLTSSMETPAGGVAFTLDLTDTAEKQFASCGYVVRLTISDRVVVNSTDVGRSTSLDRGICLE